MDYFPYVVLKIGTCWLDPSFEGPGYRGYLCESVLPRNYYPG